MNTDEKTLNQALAFLRERDFRLVKIASGYYLPDIGEYLLCSCAGDGVMMYFYCRCGLRVMACRNCLESLKVEACPRCKSEHRREWRAMCGDIDRTYEEHYRRRAINPPATREEAEALVAEGMLSPLGAGRYKLHVELGDLPANFTFADMEAKLQQGKLDYFIGTVAE